MERREEVMGVILAGGANRRYGSHKALARIGDRTILDRTVEALSPIVDRITIVANEPGPYLHMGLHVRPDLQPGLGALGGILTAVQWASDDGLEAAIVLGCDMPFLPSELIGRIALEAARELVVLPASEGPRGFEPLCAAYGTATAPAIERALDRGDRAIVSFFGDVELRILDLDEVRSFGDPDRMFWNVNRPEDRERAERMAASERGRPDTGSEHETS